MIDVIKQNIKLSGEESHIIDTVLNAHKKLRENFSSLSILLKEYTHNNNQKENIIELINDSIEFLMNHAEYEDNTLYKLARDKVNDNLKKLIENKISASSNG
jgi:hemerythrin-like domain-containing protein